MLASTPAAAVEQRDLYDRWPEFFRSWADDSTVLVGDAVHPMMPNLGQGGCQAIEDAYELTRALEEVCGATGQAPADAADVREALQTFLEEKAANDRIARLEADLERVTAAIGKAVSTSVARVEAVEQEVAGIKAAVARSGGICEQPAIDGARGLEPGSQRPITARSGAHDSDASWWW